MIEPEKLRRPKTVKANLHRKRIIRSSNQRQVPVAGEQVDVSIDIVWSRNAVQNEIKAVRLLLHRVCVF